MLKAPKLWYTQNATYLSNSLFQNTAYSCAHDTPASPPPITTKLCTTSLLTLLRRPPCRCGNDIIIYIILRSIYKY